MIYVIKSSGVSKKPEYWGPSLNGQSCWVKDKSKAWTTTSKEVADGVLDAIRTTMTNNSSDNQSIDIERIKDDDMDYYLVTVTATTQVIIAANSPVEAKNEVTSRLDYGDFASEYYGHATAIHVNDIDGILRSKDVWVMYEK